MRSKFKFPGRPASGRYFHWQRLLPQLLLTFFLMVMAAFLSLTSPHFLKWENIRNILDQSALNMILGTGMALVICTGGIDLSVGAVVALSGVLMALAVKGGGGAALGVAAAVMTGILVGTANGVLVSVLKLNPFIVTLGSMSVVRGLALIITGGIPIYGFPPAIVFWGSGSFGPVPSSVVLAGTTALAAALVLNWTKLGHYALSIGGNEEAVRRCGVPVNFYKTLIYIFGGITSATASLNVTARLNTAEPTAGWLFELDAIATAVLGGASMKGGEASISGTVIASLMLGVLRNGLTILSIPSYYQQLAIGLIILIAVIVSEIKQSSAPA